MAKINRDKVAGIHRQIGEVLLHDWDPMGVAGIPEAQDKYRGYIRGVFDVAVATRSARAVAEQLVKMERKHMSLSGRRWWRSRLPVALKILNLVSDVGILP